MKEGSHVCIGSRIGFVSHGQGCFQVERSDIFILLTRIERGMPLY